MRPDTSPWIPFSIDEIYFTASQQQSAFNLFLTFWSFQAYVGNVLCGQVAYQAGKRVYEITCANGVVGNTVTIRGGNVLTLCEVQVRGTPIDNGKYHQSTQPHNLYIK